MAAAAARSVGLEPVGLEPVTAQLPPSPLRRATPNMPPPTRAELAPPKQPKSSINLPSARSAPKSRGFDRRAYMVNKNTLYSRWGTVYTVFRQAVFTSGPRYTVFKVPLRCIYHVGRREPTESQTRGLCCGRGVLQSTAGARAPPALPRVLAFPPAGEGALRAHGLNESIHPSLTLMRTHTPRSRRAGASRA